MHGQFSVDDQCERMSTKTTEPVAKRMIGTLNARALTIRVLLWYVC